MVENSTASKIVQEEQIVKRELDFFEITVVTDSLPKVTNVKMDLMLNGVKMKWKPKKPFTVSFKQGAKVELEQESGENITLTNIGGVLFLTYQGCTFVCPRQKKDDPASAMPNIPFIVKHLRLGITVHEFKGGLGSSQ